MMIRSCEAGEGRRGGGVRGLWVVGWKGKERECRSGMRVKDDQDRG